MPSIEDLESQFHAAQAALEAYSAEVAARYRAVMPDPAEWAGPGPDPDMAVERARAWTDGERAELSRLRQAATEAAVQLHRAREAAKTEGGGD